MKTQLQSAALTVFLALSAVLCYGGLAPQPAAAMPVFVAAVGDKCDLPDGSTGKVAKDDGNTCCPAKALKGDGTVDPIACLYGKYINPTINLLAALVGVAVVTAIIYGAIEYTTSAGNPQRTEAGKKRIIEALIGLVAFLLLYSFMQFIVPGGLFNQ